MICSNAQNSVERLFLETKLFKVKNFLILQIIEKTAVHYSLKHFWKKEKRRYGSIVA